MDLTKVLIVEDEPNWLKIFYALVGDNTKELFEYIHAPDLATALNIVRNNKLGLILLDLMLPDSQQPIETIKLMSEAAKHIPIVIMSGLDDEKTINEAFLLGAEDYIVKDEYNLEIFVHVSKQAIRRFIANEKNELNNDINKLFDNLETLSNTLKKNNL